MKRLIAAASAAALALLCGGSAAAATIAYNSPVSGHFSFLVPLSEFEGQRFGLQVNADDFDYLVVIHRVDWSFAFQMDGALGGIHEEFGGTDATYLFDPDVIKDRYTYTHTPYDNSCDPRTGAFCYYYTNPMIFIEGRTLGNEFASLAYYVTPVPEPDVWALAIIGFAAVGSALRRRNRDEELGQRATGA